MIMFGTLRYSQTNQKYEHVELFRDDNCDARGYTLQACDPCRSRKVSILIQTRTLPQAHTIKPGLNTHEVHRSSVMATGTAAIDA